MNKKSIIIVLLVGLMTQNAYSMEWVKAKAMHFVALFRNAKQPLASRHVQDYQTEEETLRSLFINPADDALNLSQVEVLNHGNRPPKQADREESKGFWKYPNRENGNRRAEETATAWKNVWNIEDPDQANEKLETNKSDKQKEKEQNFWKYRTEQEGNLRAEETAKAWNKFVNRMTLNKFKFNPESAKKDFPIESVLNLKYAGEQGAAVGKTVRQYLPDRIKYLKLKYEEFLIPVFGVTNTPGKFIRTSKGKKAITERDSEYAQRNINLMTTTLIGNGETEIAARYETQMADEQVHPELAKLRINIEQTTAFSKKALTPALDKIKNNARERQTQFRRNKQNSTARVPTSPASAAAPTNPYAKDVLVNAKEDPIL